jgi:uncharacterized SAM-binding protein YcdF (DUF218 family)
MIRQYELFVFLLSANHTLIDFSRMYKQRVVTAAIILVLILLIGIIIWEKLS